MAPKREERDERGTLDESGGREGKRQGEERWKIETRILTLLS